MDAPIAARQEVGTAEFPDGPGVYVLYSTRDEPTPLYVGVAATQSLRERWTRQHLRPRAGGSALRRSLGPHLGLVTSKLRAPDRYYPVEVEDAISAFLEEAWVQLHPTPTADAAEALEARLVAELRPLLNVAQPGRVEHPAPEPGARALRAALTRLAVERPLFHSEADFQHALAWRLHLDHPQARLRLETRPLPTRLVRLDLLVTLGDRRLAIELKYVTRRFSATVQGEAYDLRGHEADDLGRYDLVKDVARIEEFTAAAAADEGYALLLTNEPRYWTAGSKPAPADAAFRLEEGRALAGVLAWGPAAGPGTVRGRDTITLRGRYPLRWADYSTVTSAVSGQFRYLLIQVLPEGRRPAE